MSFNDKTLPVHIFICLLKDLIGKQILKIKKILSIYSVRAFHFSLLDETFEARQDSGFCVGNGCEVSVKPWHYFLDNRCAEFAILRNVKK